MGDPMTTLLQIGEQLRAARKKQKLYKTQLAESSGVHRNTISNLESGAGNVELNTLIALCDQMGLDIQLVPKEVSGMVAPEGGRQQTALSRYLSERLNNTPTGDESQ